MILLASNSKTRAMILENAGVEFVQEGVDFDEDSIILDSPKSFVYQATMGKFRSVKRDDLPILVADTVLDVGGKIIRKAKDKDDARRVLELQSGNTLSIITCMVYKSSALELIDLSQTEYRFEKFDEDDLNSYLDSGEWEGKAGACMVEGFCKRYIKSVRGYESTAMGLCIEKLLPFLDG
jgi:septum formation protein